MATKVLSKGSGVIYGDDVKNVRIPYPGVTLFR